MKDDLWRSRLECKILFIARVHDTCYTSQPGPKTNFKTSTGRKQIVVVKTQNSILSTIWLAVWLYGLWRLVNGRWINTRKDRLTNLSVNGSKGLHKCQAKNRAVNGGIWWHRMFSSYLITLSLNLILFSALPSDFDLYELTFERPLGPLPCSHPTSSADHSKQGIGYRWPCAILGWLVIC